MSRPNAPPKIATASETGTRTTSTSGDSGTPISRPTTTIPSPVGSATSDSPMILPATIA